MSQITHNGEFSYKTIKYYVTTQNDNEYIFKLSIDVSIDRNLKWLHLDYTLTPIMSNDSAYTKWEKNYKFSDWKLSGGDNLSFHNSVMIKDSTLRSAGCGSLLMNEMLSVARYYMPNSSIEISLSYVDCEDEINRIRRNKFYKKFNFLLHFDDNKECTGYGKLLLNTVKLYTIEQLGFKEIDIDEYIENLAEKNLKYIQNNQELKSDIKSQNTFIDYLKTSLQEYSKKISFWRYCAIVLLTIVIILIFS